MSTVIILEESAKGMLVDLDFPRDSMDGKYIARLMKYVMGFYELDAHNCIEFVCDGHSANRRTFNQYLRKIIPNATYMTCFAHMWNNVHKDFIDSMPQINKFLSLAKMLFANSDQRVLAWQLFLEDRGIFKARPVFYVASRWSTWLKSGQYWLRYFDHFSEFIDEVDSAAQCISELKVLLRDYRQSVLVKFQLILLAILAIPLESELAKCESSSLPAAPFVLQAVSKMQEFFSQAKVDCCQDSKYIPESELFRDIPTNFDDARSEFRAALSKASK
ncbi:hypothetical protein RvY_03331-1 [Ramazzottius varieornatus]|uniref:DUF659 domain-containing protein n=1 Tax=Ramazzottius varieornatus TaxID=947166 RepID=A0A1D1UX39_RAMVA|nr:hypothetical protein RvY_03331-1 [Ramazzottius varieornatus]